MSHSGRVVAKATLAGLCLLLLSSPLSTAGRGQAVTPPQQIMLLPFYQNGKYGYIDQDGKPVITPQFAWASEFSEGLAAVAVVNADDAQLLKFGFINAQGVTKIKPQFDYASSFANRRAVVGMYNAGTNHEMRYGYIDESGTVLVKPQFRSAAPFSEEMAVVEDERKNFGYVNLAGQIAIEPQFYKAERFSQGLALAADQSGKYGYIKKDSHFLIRAQYKGGTPFGEGRAAVVLADGKVGYIDLTGKPAFAAKFDAGRPFSEKVAAVREGRHWHYIKADGTRAFGKDFDQALSFSEELAAVRVGKEWGYIDHTGEFRIELQFDTASPFSRGRALVTDGIYLKRTYVGRDGRSINALAAAAEVPPPPFQSPNAVIEMAGAGFGDPDVHMPVEVHFKSKPDGAIVYLMTLNYWDKHPNVILDSRLLDGLRFEGGSTPSKATIAQKAYMAVFEREGRRIPLKVEVMKDKVNDYGVDFK